LRQISKTKGVKSYETNKVVSISLNLIRKSCLFAGLLSSICLPILIQIFIPKYNPSIILSIILSFVGASIGLGQSCIDFTLAIGKKIRILRLTSFTIPIVLMSHWLFWINSYSINLLALSLFICIIIYTCKTYDICMFYYEIKNKFTFTIIKDSLIYLFISLFYGFILTNISVVNNFLIFTLFVTMLLFIYKELRVYWKLLSQYQNLNKLT